MARTLTARSARAGFTLMELLISIAIFMLLGMLLVSLLRGGVNLWESGEARRDAYERSAILLESFRSDITCATIHREVNAGTPNCNFSCVPDKRGRPILFFTRVGLVPVQGTQPAPKGVADTTFYSAPDTMKRNEIIYFLDPDPASTKLYRCQFALNNDYGMTMPLDQFTQKAWITANASLLMDGVLYVGYRFWSQKTVAWNPKNGEPGPLEKWDSTRFRDKTFGLFRGGLQNNDPLDDIVPHRVEVTITLERPGSPDAARSRIKTSIDRASTTIPADILRNFPNGPGLARIDDEWISYERAGGGALTGVKRGLRGTVANDHAAEAPLRYGESFTTVIPIPAFKDDTNP